MSNIDPDTAALTRAAILYALRFMEKGPEVRAFVLARKVESILTQLPDSTTDAMLHAEEVKILRELIRCILGLESPRTQPPTERRQVMCADIEQVARIPFTDRKSGCECAKCEKAHVDQEKLSVVGKIIDVASEKVKSANDENWRQFFQSMAFENIRYVVQERK